MRSAPILLTYTDGRFYEVFISDDVHDFEQASFASARVFQRDIMRADSLLIFEDGTVAREARTWMQSHPDAQPLDPDDEASDDAPPTFVSDDIEIIDVHGPWLSFGHTLDVDVAGRRRHLHQRRHGVIDVRSGARTSLQGLFGADEAARLQAMGRTAFVALTDSVRRSMDERSDAARRTLASFSFDSMSFGLTEVSRIPAIAFLVPGMGEQGEALSLFLPPQTAAVPAWWRTVAQTLAQWNSDSTELSWARAQYRVVARPSDDGDALAIELVDMPRRGAPRHWPIATVPAPAYQLISLDETPLDSLTRNALARAFDQSTVVNGATQTASVPVRSSMHSSLRVVNRRVPFGAENVGTACCRSARRFCRATAKHSPPASSICFFIGSRFSILREVIATCAPYSAKTRATPPVIPVPPPVTKAVLPCKMLSAKVLLIMNLIYQGKGKREKGKGKNNTAFKFFVFCLLLSVFCLLSSCGYSPEDLRQFAPSDTLIWLETNNIEETLNAVTENETFQKITTEKTDFSALDGVQIAVAVTGLKLRKKQITDNQSILNFKPKFAVIAETHAWSWQMNSLVENNLDGFIRKQYGADAKLEKNRKDAGTLYKWTSNDNRQSFAFVEGSLIFFGNNEESIEKCLAAKKGAAENLTKNDLLNSKREATKNSLIFGYVSGDGIKQIADLIGVKQAIETSEEEAPRSFISRILPEIVRGTIKEISWTATKTKIKLKTNFSLKPRRKSRRF